MNHLVDTSLAVIAFALVTTAPALAQNHVCSPQIPGEYFTGIDQRPGYGAATRAVAVNGGSGPNDDCDGKASGASGVFLNTERAQNPGAGTNALSDASANVASEELHGFVSLAQPAQRTFPGGGLAQANASLYDTCTVASDTLQIGAPVPSSGVVGLPAIALQVQVTGAFSHSAGQDGVGWFRNFGSTPAASVLLSWSDANPRTLSLNPFYNFGGPGSSVREYQSPYASDRVNEGLFADLSGEFQNAKGRPMQVGDSFLFRAELDLSFGIGNGAPFGEIATDFRVTVVPVSKAADVHIVCNGGRSWKSAFASWKSQHCPPFVVSGPPGFPPTRTVQMAIIPARYKNSTGRLSIDEIAESAEYLRDYYYQQSGCSVQIEPYVVSSSTDPTRFDDGWLELPLTLAQYQAIPDTTPNFTVQATTVWLDAYLAAAAADPDGFLARQQLGFFDTVLIIDGSNSYRSRALMLNDLAHSLPVQALTDFWLSVIVRGAASIITGNPEFSLLPESLFRQGAILTKDDLGTWAHESGHALFSFWDYYGTTEFTVNGMVGSWDLMGTGDGLQPPSPIMAYNKANAGWITYRDIPVEQYGDYALTATKDLTYGQSVLRVKPQRGVNDWFIVERRAPPDDVGPPDLHQAFMPTSSAFGNQRIGTTSSSATFTYRNRSPVFVAAPSVAITPPTSGAFVLAANDCNQLLQPGASCTFQVAFSPSTTGSDSADVVVTGGPDTGHASLTGTGVTSVPDFSFSPTTLSFDPQPVGTGSPDQTVTVTYNGAPVYLNLFTTGRDLSDFTVSDGTCKRFAIINPGTTCTISVRFEPTKPGERAASVSSLGNNEGAVLRGFATPAPGVLLFAKREIRNGIPPRVPSCGSMPSALRATFQTLFGHEIGSCLDKVTNPKQPLNSVESFTLLPGTSFEDPEAGVDFSLSNDFVLSIAKNDPKGTNQSSLQSSIDVPDDSSASAGIAADDRSATVDLHIYTADGRHIGPDSSTLRFELGVPEARAGGMGTSAQWISLPDTISATAVIDASGVFADFAALGLTPNVKATFTLVHYDEAGNVTEMEPVTFVATVDKPVSDPIPLPTRDKIAPTIRCPADFARPNDHGLAGAVVTYSVTATDDRSDVTVISSPVSGSFFPLGATTVTATATDAAGNAAGCSFRVAVNDTEPPVITVPPSVTVEATSPAGAVVSDAQLGSATATDNSGLIIVVTRGAIPPGNLFPVGATTITYTAPDASGNVATAQQTVTVRPFTPPTNTACTVSGAGWIDSAQPKYFAFAVRYQAGWSAPQGGVVFADTRANQYLRSIAITRLTCAGTHAEIAGTALTLAGTVSFVVQVDDRGAKGAGDAFAIQWPVYQASRLVATGDIIVRIP